MTKLEFTNKILDNLNSSMSLNGKINLDKFIDLTNKQYEAITVTPCCTELCDDKDKVFICENETCMMRKCKKCGEIA